VSRPLAQDYLKQSRAAVHSFAAVAPLVLLHAMLTWLFEPPVGSAAAAWVLRPLIAFGLTTLEATLALAALFLLAGLALSARQIARRQVRVQPRIIPLIWLEGLAWGSILHVAWNGLLPQGGVEEADPLLRGLGHGDSLALALGAGIYEELVFRVAVFFVVLHAVRMVSLPWRGRRRSGEARAGSTLVAVLITSLLFALAHHLGGEPFSLGAVAFRTLAALYLTTLYAFRGLGVAVTAHAAYDVWVSFV
jgi:membrane protease YdiL (CAAX protease family)